MKTIVGKWAWWVGSSDEFFTQECETRAEAVEVARDEFEGAYICEAITEAVSLSSYFCAHPFIEEVEEQNEPDLLGEYGEGPIFDCSIEQIEDLEHMVRAAIDAWQKKHKLQFVPFVFTSMRNDEFINPVEVAEGADK